MTPDELEVSAVGLEVELLLEALHRRYGYDFREYAPETIVRRVKQFLVDERLTSVSELQGRVIRDRELFFLLTSYFSINVTSFFRDPPVYAQLRRAVLPVLRTWPHLKVWDAGCATGEESYSLAILLHEEGLLERSTLYATDINQTALDTGKAGIYPLAILKKGAENYLAAEGRSTFSDYFHAEKQAGKLDSRLRLRLTFARHNLTVDGSFGDMHLVVCRNVLIYFNADLKDRVLRLFCDSLENGGFLCLGDKESLAFTAVEQDFEVVDYSTRLYRKRSI